ncbi:MAG: glutathione peroxidase [Acidobacteria bacterium]|nr:glutathione peroxidase [Acidobacteriota bacterium]
MNIIKITGGVLVLGLCAVVGLAYAYGFILDPSPATPPRENSMYEFTMKDIDGKDIKLEAYKGKVVMIVNTASRCGNTPQYEGLQKIYDKYKDKGFVVLGFPANNFMGQEPGSDEEIKEFCTLNYNVTFPMFSKISVKGADQHPFYSFLTHKETNPGFDGDITWNFEKFLADKDGKIIARFTPKTKPEDEKVVEAIEKALAAE